MSLGWAFLEHAEEELGAIEEEEFASLSPGTTGVSLSWAMVVDEIRADVRTYLETEREVAAEGWEPIATEEAFERIRLGRGTAELTIRGKADRVDQRDGELRVIDYKTGMVRERADGYQKGQSLQLPLYMEAASEGHETPLELIRAEYHYVSRRGRFSRVGLAGATLSGDETYAAALGHFRDGIASGAFFYVPGYNRRNCSFCDFSRVCHPRVEQNHTKKMPGSRDLSRAFDGLTGGRL